jgi:predicted alpha/beta-hydrolase family hydrolase
MRTAHFPTLRTPTLFVQGTKDPFGSIEEMESAVKLIPANTRVLRVEGVGHSLMSKSNKDELVKVVVEAFRDFRE